MSLPVAILAGGLATRLRPLTESIPKILLEVAGRPFATHQIELLREHGLKHFVFCVGYLGEMVQAALGDGRRWGVKIDYVFDGSTLLGTGGALRKALPKLGEAFFVLYGDSYLECDYQVIEKSFRLSGKRGLMTVLQNHNKWDRSNVAFANGSISCYDKRITRADMIHIDYGLGALHADVFNDYPGETVLDLATVYQDLVARNELAGYEASERFYEIGSATGLEELRQHLTKREVAIPHPR